MSHIDLTTPFHTNSSYGFISSPSSPFPLNCTYRFEEEYKHKHKHKHTYILSIQHLTSRIPISNTPGKKRRRAKIQEIQNPEFQKIQQFPFPIYHSTKKKTKNAFPNAPSLLYSANHAIPLRSYA